MLSLRLVGISLGYFMVMLDSTILNVALPDMSHDLGGGVATQQWTVNAYTVAFGALLLSSGAIADRFGAARVFRVGMVGFGVASLLCALAPTAPALIGLRAVQGVAAAAAPSSTLALLGLLYTDPGIRSRAIGLWSGLTGIGFAAGPLIGGVIVDLVGWRGVFWVNVPIALVGLAMTWRLPLSPGHARPLDVRTQLTATATIALLVATVIEAPHGRALIPGLLAMVTVAALVLTERRSAAPAFPAVVLRVRELRETLLIGLVVQFQVAGGLFLIGLYLLQTRGLSPTTAGLAFVPFTAGPLLAPVSGRLTARFGAQRVIRVGLTLAAIGNLLTAVTVADRAPVWLISITALLIGLAIPALFVPLTGQVVGFAPEGTGGTAGGLFNAFRQFGASLGVAALGAVLSVGGPTDGTVWGLSSSAVLALLALLWTLTSALRPPRSATGGRGPVRQHSDRRADVRARDLG